ncbi:MAG: recombination mediator RecR [Polyangiaceae bacterium]
MYPKQLQECIDLLAKLPGVGEKTAARYALFLVTANPAFVRVLGQTLESLPERVQPCVRCGFLAEIEPVEEGDTTPPKPPICAICSDNKRDSRTLCVVGRVQDVLAFERSGAMRGRYFVLSKLLSPLEGVGPDQMPRDALLKRVEDENVEEVIVATPATVDGEATALWLARELGAVGVQVTRIASGIPHGGDIEYADQITLGKALEGRRAIE